MSVSFWKQQTLKITTFESKHKTYNKNKTVREVAKEKKLMSDKKLDRLLNIKGMIKSK